MTGSELRASVGMQYFNVYVTTEFESYPLYTGDNAKVVIETWFEEQAVHPTCVSICASSKEAACMLMDYAYSRKDLIEDLHKSHKNPYKLQYMLDSIDSQHANRCRGFCGYGDQVFPFDLA